MVSFSMGYVIPKLAPYSAFSRLNSAESYQDCPVVRSMRITKTDSMSLSRAVQQRQWKVVLGSGELRWKDKTAIDTNSLTSHFIHTESDFRSCRGQWSVKATREGALINCTIHFDIGLVGFGQDVDTVVDGFFRNYYRSLLGYIYPQGHASEESPIEIQL